MYKYEEIRPKLFTDEGQRKFLKVRDRVFRILEASGAIRMQEAISGTGGDSWELVACIDRLVELQELREIIQPYPTIGQNRIFVRMGIS